MVYGIRTLSMLFLSNAGTSTYTLPGMGLMGYSTTKLGASSQPIETCSISQEQSKHFKTSLKHHLYLDIMGIVTVPILFFFDFLFSFSSLSSLILKNDPTSPFPGRFSQGKADLK